MVESTPDGNFGGPDDAVFVRGIDYVSAWREADKVAQEFNDAATELGLDDRVLRAVPHAGAHGEPVIWIRPEGVRMIVAVLDEAAKWRQAG